MSLIHLFSVHFVKLTDSLVQQTRANKVLKRFFPNAGDLRLYRTAEGEIGIKIDLDLKPDDRQRLDKAYDEIMKVLGEKRGRPRGVKKVQTKLMLPNQHTVH